MHIYLESKNSYSGSTDPGRSPNSVLIGRQRRGVLMRKGRGTITSIKGRHFSWHRQYNTVTLILKNKCF